MIKATIDLSALDGFKNLDSITQNALQTAIKQLANQTYSHIIEQAHVKLHTRESMFTDALSQYQEDANTYVINLKAEARWIDEGLAPRNLVDQLLNSKKAKTSKTGARYLSVPFKHNKGPSQQTPQQALLFNTIKQVLKDAKTPLTKTEMDAQGNVKTGLVRSLNITNLPLKTSNMPGQGKGQVGLVQQGYSPDGKSGIPLLSGVRIYQRQYQTSTGRTKTAKDVMTFRTVSSNHIVPEPKKGGQLQLFAMGNARWDHPGLAPTNLMQEGADWAAQQLTDRIGPAMLDKIKVSL